MLTKLTRKKFSTGVHLKCFEPLYPTFIRLEDINTSLLPKENEKRVHSWLQVWNSKHIFPVSTTLEACKIMPSFLHQSTPYTRKISRPLVLIFTYLDIKEILTNVALVSKYFYSLTFSDLLWKEICFLYFKPDQINMVLDKLYREYRPQCEDWKWKEIFFLLLKNCCVECRSLGLIGERICPILKRPLCASCRRKEKYNLVTLSDLKRYQGMYLTHVMENYAPKFAKNHRDDKVFYKYYVDHYKKILKTKQVTFPW